jgi:peptidyl-prolyl cis-trans isomerase SurA
MIAKVFIIFILSLIHNIFLNNLAFSKEKYIEVDSIVAIAETETITRAELNKKQEKIKKTILEQEGEIPSNKEIIKLALDQLIKEKLLIEYASRQGISITQEQLNNVISDIAKSNNITIEELITNVEDDGSSFAEFRESIQTQLIIQQIKKRIIGANLKISEFEIDNYIELQKERTPTKYDYSHIFIAFEENNEEIDLEKTKIKLKKINNQLNKNNFNEMVIEYSDDPMTKKRGLMKYVTTDEIPDIFFGIIESLKVGEVSEPIKSSNGFHILKLNDIQEFEIPSIVVKQSKAKQILLKKNQIVSEDEIERKLAHIRNMIIEGMDFSAAAEKYSEDSSSANKGDLGWLNPGDTIPEFEKEMDKLNLSEISQPFKTSLGWHLIQVNDRREKDLSSESLRQRVKENLLAQKIEIKFIDWVKSLKEGAYVEIWLYED